MQNKPVLYQQLFFDQMAIPKSLLLKYKDLNMSEVELVVILQIIRLQSEGNYLPSIQLISQSMTQKEYEVAQVLRQLMQKKLLVIEQHKEDEVIHESYSFEPILRKLYELDNNNSKEMSSDKNLFILFEQEFGRALSPIEIEMIGHWLDDDQMSPALIKAALREAVLMAKLNFRYIDRILNEWNKKGVKTVEDARKFSQSFRNKTNTNQATNQQKKRDTSVYYNWLEGEE